MGRGCKKNPGGFIPFKDESPLTNSVVFDAVECFGHWKNGHRIDGSCIAEEPATQVEAIALVDRMVNWIEARKIENTRNEQQRQKQAAEAKRMR